ncbi:hypothetical protein MMAN_52370 [Mycobacterium mantenii]|uniref:3'-phosphate/5'-hydroxy nucleic acid ligase n=1 Tax=Mycobacterium mantenii TaxID=560555 RepID=A0ABM7JZS4_MYCNT|nr:RtcB family protein [Mycobacterium mantenii]BBY41103.1 hypothetical protein MMAN_52370 [Mycobacterium mantenii]
MAAAANYGRANRQLLTEATRRVFEHEIATSLDLLYDVSHNLAKIEDHLVDGQTRTLCVHRKGATRSLRRTIPTCRPTWPRSDNRCSSPAPWEPPPTC